MPRKVEIYVVPPECELAITALSSKLRVEILAQCYSHFSKDAFSFADLVDFDSLRGVALSTLRQNVDVLIEAGALQRVSYDSRSGRPFLRTDVEKLWNSTVKLLAHIRQAQPVAAEVIPESETALAASALYWQLVKLWDVEIEVSRALATLKVCESAPPKPAFLDDPNFVDREDAPEYSTQEYDDYWWHMVSKGGTRALIPEARHRAEALVIEYRQEQEQLKHLRTQLKEDIPRMPIDELLAIPHEAQERHEQFGHPGSAFSSYTGANSHMLRQTYWQLALPINVEELRVPRRSRWI